jgi:hypothetical protein
VIHAAVVDWNEITAIATGLLAVAAIVAGVLAGPGLRPAAEDLKTSKAQLQGSRRPTVVPCTEQVVAVQEADARLAVPERELNSALLDGGFRSPR